MTIFFQANAESGIVYPPYSTADDIQGNGVNATRDTVTSPNISGSRAYRLILPADTVTNRRQLTLPYTWTEGAEQWMHCSLYFDPNWDFTKLTDNGSTFASIFSFRGDVSNGWGSIIFNGPTLFHKRAALSVDNFADGAGQDTISMGAVSKGIWINYKMHFIWSTVTGVALKEFWRRDGTSQATAWTFLGRSRNKNMWTNARTRNRIGIYQGGGANEIRTLYWDQHYVTSTESELNALIGTSTPPTPAPAPPPPALTPGPVGDAFYEVGIGPVASPRTGDVVQLNENDGAPFVDLPIGTASHRRTGRTNGQTYKVKARVGSTALGFGSYTPDAQAVSMTPNAATAPPSPTLFMRPNADVVAVAGQTWSRASSARAFWEHVNSNVSRLTPATDPALTGGDTIDAFNPGKILELGFTTVTRPANGFSEAFFCMNMLKTGPLGVEVRVRVAPGGAQTLIGSVSGPDPQPQQTYAIPIPLTLLDSQSKLDNLQVELRTVGASGETWTPEVWVELVPGDQPEQPPAPTDPLVLSKTALSFTALAGASPAAQTFTVTAASPQVFSLSEDMPWAAASADQPTTPATVTVTPNGAGLAAGTRQGTVTLTDSEARKYTVAVTFVSTAPVDLVVQPTSLAFPDAETGTATLSLPLVVSNVGGLGDVSFTVTDDQTWLATPSGSFSAPATINVTADPSGQPAGPLTGQVTVVGALETINVPVSWTLTAPPVDPGGEDPPPDPVPEPTVRDRVFHGSGWPANTGLTVMSRLVYDPPELRERYDPQTGVIQMVMLSRPVVAFVDTDADGNFDALLEPGPYWVVGIVDGEFRYVAIKAE